MLDPKMNNFPDFGHNRSSLKKSKTVTLTHFYCQLLENNEELVNILLYAVQ